MGRFASKTELIAVLSSDIDALVFRSSDLLKSALKTRERRRFYSRTELDLSRHD
jgi:hypothetical protein